MTTFEAQAPTATLDDLMYQHRVEWAAAVAGTDAVDLQTAGDPLSALETAKAAVWLDGYEPGAREAVIRAAARGTKLVVAVPAGTSDGEDLARAVPDATMVPQTPAGGSLIGNGGRADVTIAEPAARENASWLLVCANVDIDTALAHLDVAASARLGTQFARMREALEALRDANVRLAREHLGRHDAAAGAMIGRAEIEAQQLREKFAFEQQLARDHNEWFQAAEARANAAEARLAQPLHRLADKIYGALRRIPGVRALVTRAPQH